MAAKIICRSCGAGFPVTAQSLRAVPGHQIRTDTPGVKRTCPGTNRPGKLNRNAGTGDQKAQRGGTDSSDR